jgi:hypothetical protein
MFISDMAIVLSWLGFGNTKVTLMHSTHLHKSNTLYEDMTTIMRSLIRGFLQTHSIDVINQTSFSHKAPGISELHHLSSSITP